MTSLLTAPEGADEQFCYRKQSDEAPSEAVLSAVSTVSGRSVVSYSSDEDCLEPLYDAIEPDALDALFRSDCDGAVIFSYSGYEITVRSTGKILLSEPSNGEA